MSKKNTSGQKAQLINVAAPEHRELTVYNTGFAVVQEWRKLDLSQGLNQIQLDGMPNTYQNNSLLLFEYAGEGALTLGQGSLRPANLTPEALLSRSVGQQVTVRLHSGGSKQTTICGKLLQYSGNQLIVQLSSGRTWIGNASDDMELGEVPEDLTNSSALVLDVDATAAGAHQAKFLYFANGLQWKAFHKAVYDEKAGLLKLFKSDVGVTNNCGTAFNHSQLKLLAGDIGLPDAREMIFAAAPMAAGRSMKSAAVREASFESVGDQKLYVVDGNVSLAVGENKEIPLFAAGDVPVEREYFLPYCPARQHGPEDESLEPVSIRLRLLNNADSKLGKPLPAGRVSIFQLDSSGSPQFTGAAQMDHVADGERFELLIGASSDIKADRRLVSFEEDEPEVKKPEPPRTVHPLGGPDVGRPRNPADLVNQDALEGGDEEEKPRFRTEVREVTVHNFKTDREVSVNVYDEFPSHAEVKVDREHKFEAKTATTHAARLTVPAKGKVVLTYTLKYSVR